MSTERELIFAFHTSRAGWAVPVCEPTIVCADRDKTQLTDTNIIYLQPCLNITIFHTFTQIWQRQPSPELFLPGCCTVEIQCAQMGEATALVPRYRMQKCLVCFSTDKTDIFWGVPQTIAMKEQSPIWHSGSPWNPLWYAQWELERQNILAVDIVLIESVARAVLDITGTSPLQRGLLPKKSGIVWIHKHLFTVWCCAGTVYVFDPRRPWDGKPKLYKLKKHVYNFLFGIKSISFTPASHVWEQSGWAALRPQRSSQECQCECVWFCLCPHDGAHTGHSGFMMDTEGVEKSYLLSL